MASMEQGLPLTLYSYWKRTIERSENIFYVCNYSDINNGKTVPLITPFSLNTVNQEYFSEFHILNGSPMKSYNSDIHYRTVYPGGH